MIADQRGRTILVTGGTRGIGLATALAFARRGGTCVLTHAWGTADEAELQRKFQEVDARPPIIIQADVTKAADTTALMDALAGRVKSVDVFISNAANALIVKKDTELTEHGLLQSVRGSVWPTFEYLRQIRTAFGTYPRHVVVVSSNGPDQYSRHYDFVAASKAMLETLCRYQTYRLREEDIRINVLRTRGVKTASLDAAFGAELMEFAKQWGDERDVIAEDEVANVALALCSGLLDGMRGQIVTVDRGGIFSDNLMGIFERKWSEQ